MDDAADAGKGPQRSGGALTEIIDCSTLAPYVATFAAYRVPAVRSALGSTVERVVRVWMILEAAAEGNVTDAAFALNMELGVLIHSELLGA